MDWHLFVQPAATLLASFAGSISGALLAFKLNTRAKAKEDENKKVMAANRVLFTLCLQQNTLTNFKRQALEGRRNEPGRHFDRAMFPLKDAHRVDTTSIDFLIESKFKSTLLDVAIADSWYDSILQTIRDRYRLQHDVIQPMIEEFMDKQGRPSTFGELEKYIGPRLTLEAKQVTDSLYHLMDKNDERHSKVAVRLAQELRELFPKKKFITFTIPPDPQSKL